MKTTRIIVLLGMLAFLGTRLNAQAIDESLVKIVPTAKQGVLKVIYGIETTGPLKVTFITNKGVIGSDNIKGGSYPTGLSKRYNFENINDRDFWIEVASPQMTVTYRISPEGYKGGFTPYLEKTEYHETVVKATR